MFHVKKSSAATIFLGLSLLTSNKNAVCMNDQPTYYNEINLDKIYPQGFEDDLPTHKIFLAARNGDHENLNKFLGERPGLISIPDKNGLTILDFACISNSYKTVKVAILAGSHVNKNNYKAEDYSTDGPLSLHFAAARGNIKIMKLLIRYGAQVNSNAHPLKATPLHITVFYNHASSIKFLIDQGAQVDALNCYGSTPLHIATFNNDVQCTQILFDNGASLSVKNIAGNTPVALASARADQRCYNILQGPR